jgi:hypothetical protein
MGRVGLMPLGGLRAFAAAGATIIVGKGDGAFYRKVMSAPETLNPYGTKPVPRVVAVEAVRMRPPSGANTALLTAPMWPLRTTRSR